MSSQRVVIVGGGFAGVTLAQRLERVAPPDVDLVLISSENHFVFTPLLAEAAGREISPQHVVVPGREMVKRARWLTAEVTAVDREANQVYYISYGGRRGALSYDHLALACGSVVDFSAIPGLSDFAHPFRTIGDAVFLSNDLIGRLEEAALYADPEERQRLLTVVVIGGGFSGVEVAAALNDLMQRTRRFYPQLRDVQPRIVMLQRGARILPEFGAASLSAYALMQLRAEGVEVRLGAEAREVTSHGVVTTAGEVIAAGTIVCTIGNASNPVLKTLGVPLEKGRLRTEPDMRVIGLPNVWALGDNALVPNAAAGKPSSPTAQFAVRQAEQLAANLANALGGRPSRAFAFKPVGMMASIGRHNAVAEVFGLRLSGFFAWILWRAVYLGKMPTTLRKVEVTIDWIRSIFFPPSVVQLHVTRTAKIPQTAKSIGELT